MNDTQTTTLEVDEANAPLSALDRCDSCGAQAYIRATMESGTLLFCAHHAAKHREALEPLAKVWHDESAKLSERGPLDAPRRGPPPREAGRFAVPGACAPAEPEPGRGLVASVPARVLTPGSRAAAATATGGAAWPSSSTRSGGCARA